MLDLNNKRGISWIYTPIIIGVICIIIIGLLFMINTKNSNPDENNPELEEDNISETNSLCENLEINILSVEESNNTFTTTIKREDEGNAIGGIFLVYVNEESSSPVEAIHGNIGYEETTEISISDIDFIPNKIIVKPYLLKDEEKQLCEKEFSYDF